jgi:L-ascorbate metabolism protein UlaG (beta-lactamase superfamily)
MALVLTTIKCSRLVAGILALLVAAALAAPAQAACTGPVALRDGIVKAGFVPASLGGGEVGLTFLGHASFLLESPSGTTIVTDYNGYIRAPFPPDIVTMNMAHSTHYTDTPDPAIGLVLRGWDPAGGIAMHDVTIRDVRIRNIPTNIRDYGATRYAGNSIFVFDIVGLCIVHLSHLHHTLTPTHLADLGQVDVLLAPVDGTWTMSHDDMVQVVRDIRPALVVPMHYFTETVLEHFLAKLEGYAVRRSRVASITLSRDTLPERPEVLILPGH